MANVQNSLSNAAKLASLNMILQIFLRIGTFVANAFLLRLVSPELLGVINVRLLLLYTTSQLLSREATRRACLGEAKQLQWPLIASCIWINVPIGLLVGSGLSFIWLTTLSVPSSSLIDAYHFAVLAMPLSVWIELLSEPMYIYGQLNAFVKLRVLIDGCTQTARTFVLVLVAYLTQSDSQTLYAFAIVYVFTAIFYSFAYAIYFAYHFKTQTHSLSISSFLPTFDHFKNVNMWRLLNLCWSFFKQTVLKQFLTEGERFVMTFLSLLPLDQQGLFHVVGNVGALAARFVFAPVEEASFLHFSQLLHRSDSKNELLKSTAATAARTLQLLLRGMTLVGMFGLAFGIPFASTVLGAYGGIKLVTDDAVKLLRFQCAYIALIALNGILETFTFASMSNRQLARFNYALIAFSLLFLVSSGPLVRLLSLPGFVVASCMPMIGRIMFGWFIVKDYFKKCEMSNPLLNFLPNKFVLLSLTVASLILSQFEASLIRTSLTDHAILIVTGIPFLLLSFFVVYKKEQELIGFVRNDLIKSKKT